MCLIPVAATAMAQDQKFMKRRSPRKIQNRLQESDVRKNAEVAIVTVTTIDLKKSVAERREPKKSHQKNLKKLKKKRVLRRNKKVALYRKLQFLPVNRTVTVVNLKLPVEMTVVTALESLNQNELYLMMNLVHLEADLGLEVAPERVEQDLAVVHDPEVDLVQFHVHEVDQNLAQKVALEVDQNPVLAVALTHAVVVLDLHPNLNHDQDRLHVVLILIRGIAIFNFQFSLTSFLA